MTCETICLQICVGHSEKRVVSGFQYKRFWTPRTTRFSLRWMSSITHVIQASVRATHMTDVLSSESCIKPRNVSNTTRAAIFRNREWVRSAPSASEDMVSFAPIALKCHTHQWIVPFRMTESGSKNTFSRSVMSRCISGMLKLSS